MAKSIVSNPSIIRDNSNNVLPGNVISNVNASLPAGICSGMIRWLKR